MKAVTRVFIATAMIAVAVVFVWMRSEIPTRADREIVESFIYARDNAFRTQDVTAYRESFTSDFQMKGNPMAFEDYPPNGVEALIENVPLAMIDVTSTVRVTHVREYGGNIKRISFLVHSSYNAGESGSAGGLTLTFVRRDGKWFVSRMEQYQPPPYFFYAWY